jgi:hypothetical protein
VFYTPSPLPSLRIPFFLRLIGHNSLGATGEEIHITWRMLVLNQQKVVTGKLMVRNMGGAISGTVFFFKVQLN